MVARFAFSEMEIPYLCLSKGRIASEWLTLSASPGRVTRYIASLRQRARDTSCCLARNVVQCSHPGLAIRSSYFPTSPLPLHAKIDGKNIRRLPNVPLSSLIAANLLRRACRGLSKHNAASTLPAQLPGAGGWARVGTS